MSTQTYDAKARRLIVDSLTKSPKDRTRLIESCLTGFGLTSDELSDNSADSKKNRARSSLGAIINEMHAEGLIALDEKGRYYAISTRPVVIRIEKCQKEVIKLLSEHPSTKFDIKNRLTSVFGTDKTPTKRDDDTLATYLGQLLKRMLADGIITEENNLYALAPKISARAEDINDILSLKSEFILRLHSKGGEFFENYFMTLLEKYATKHGKRVLECYVAGGSDDGGIDGIMKTEDSLGFRETVMVQTKNRIDLASETDVRGFYGAVCAKQGSRGIFVVTSDFHSGAIRFLEPLDDCVGISGNKLFAMATECLYGIKKKNGAWEIDDSIL